LVGGCLYLSGTPLGKEIGADERMTLSEVRKRMGRGTKRKEGSPGAYPGRKE
jgi:hypothetical protein